MPALSPSRIAQPRLLFVALLLAFGAAAQLGQGVPASASRVAAVNVSSILPKGGFPGDQFAAQVRGAGFVNGATVSLGDGVAVQVKSVDARGRSIDVQVTIAQDAEVGPRDLLVTNPGGASDTDPNGFRVEEKLPAGPQIGSLSPTQGLQGQTLNVAIDGAGFVQGATVSFGQEIIINSAQVSSVALDHILTVNITIDASAELGKRDVSVRNPGTQNTVKEDAFEVTAAESGKLKVAPKKVTFPATKAGKFKTKKLKIKNIGDGQLNGSITPPAEGSGFVMNPQQTDYSLNAGETLILNVEFHPAKKGKKTAEMIITSNDPKKPSVTVPIKGKGK